MSKFTEEQMNGFRGVSREILQEGTCVYQSEKRNGCDQCVFGIENNGYGTRCYYLPEEVNAGIHPDGKRCMEVHQSFLNGTIDFVDGQLHGVEKEDPYKIHKELHGVEKEDTPLTPEERLMSNLEGMRKGWFWRKDDPNSAVEGYLIRICGDRPYYTALLESGETGVYANYSDEDPRRKAEESLDKKLAQIDLTDEEMDLLKARLRC